MTIIVNNNYVHNNTGRIATLLYTQIIHSTSVHMHDR